MSRHELSPRNHWPNVKSVVVGWDRPLETFFLQVIGNGGGVKVWKGTRVRELPTAASVLSAASDYASIPEDILGKLQADQAADGAEDSPLQAMLKQGGVVR